MTIDHLVYATPDLAGTVEALRAQGVPLVPGGPHVGRGTRNHLAGLGDGTYLEVIGPDPEQPEPQEPRPFGIDDLTAPRLVTWAARVSGFPDRELLGPVPMSRRRPDGVLLEWELAFPPGGDGLVPFLIDWHDSPHPAESLDHSVRLVSFHGVHPDPDRVAREVAALGESLEVRRGERPGLEAELATPKGSVVLR
ncbi:Glyoxalase-like domain-containing protein [Amycolatopsis sacchari]|uniref:Glyoxalase-like domain-containing protein n=1 Tax=Amycolatopsis sacchari TaxID=115433 RepID=A0A1I3ZCI8_9PSEU|nr:VOC family protein [Amycolatopsis sacchari]SFK41712.1 Glyoxalase-like domain-containing protein [Amycolatopsis sacchari]